MITKISFLGSTIPLISANTAPHRHSTDYKAAYAGLDAQIRFSDYIRFFDDCLAYIIF